MKGMKRIPQEESEDNKKALCDNKNADNSFTKLIFYFIILNIFIFIILANTDLLKLAKNDLNTESKNQVKIAFYCESLAFGEVEKLTSLLINYLSKESIFDIYLFLNKDSQKEYLINSTIHRINIQFYSPQILRRLLIGYKIEFFIYQLNNIKDIKVLKNLNETNDITTLFINYSGFLYWIYNNDYHFFSNLYNTYKESNYLVSFIPFENDIILKKWEINSIYMNFLLPFDYNSTQQLDLSSKTILMIGKGSDKMKRLDLGIKAMKYIIKEIPDSKMKIVTDLNGRENLKILIKELNLENNIIFEEYYSSNEIYFNNISLHLLPSIAEGTGLDICETKFFGIPNVLVGLDYLPCSKGGVSIIYDDSPESIALECIKILNDEKYRKSLGNEARESMKNFDNKIIADKWMRLILSAYLDEAYFNRIKEEGNELINSNEEKKILNNQIKLLKMRLEEMKNVNLNEITNFSFMKQIYKLKSWKFFF